jgi:hypothetical protein
MTTTAEGLRITPTLSQVRAKWETDLQVEGLSILAGAAASSRPADYIAAILDTIRDSYAPREATYLVDFITGHAGERGLLGA